MGAIKVLLVAASGYQGVNHDEVVGGWAARHPAMTDKITNAVT
jgi:hypothetical protein